MDQPCSIPDCTHTARRNGHCLAHAVLALRDKVTAARLEHIPPTRP